MFHVTNEGLIMTASSASRVQKHRDALRAGGLRPVQIWVPDTRSADFAQECQRQSRMLAQDPHEAQEAAWAEAAAAQTPGWV